MRKQGSKLKGVRKGTSLGTNHVLRNLFITFVINYYIYNLHKEIYQDDIDNHLI